MDNLFPPGRKHGVLCDTLSRGLASMEKAALCGSHDKTRDGARAGDGTGDAFAGDSDLEASYVEHPFP